MGQEHRGAKIGPRVATLVSQATVATHKKLIGTKHKLAMMIFNSISDEISKEVDDTIGPILNALADEYPGDGQLRGLVDFMARNHGQLKAMSGASVVGQSLFWALSTIINNQLARTVYDAVSGDPHMLPDPGTIATLAAGGFVDKGNAENAIAGNGFVSYWADAMIQAAQTYPGPADLLDMLRRNIIDEGGFIQLAQKNGLAPEDAQRFIELKDIPLSPADAALAVLRGNMPQGEAESQAKAWGITPDVFNILIGNTGEPLGLMQLLEAFRRGFIDEGRLVEGIKQSRVRNEWVDVALALRYAPMSVSDAVRAVVQNQLDFNTAAAIAQDNGLEPGQFEVLVNTEGNPLSRTEMADLYNRGEATKDEFMQALRESRLKNKYNDLAFKLNERLLEPRSLSAAVFHGLLSHADAVKVALDYGFSAKSAEVLIGTASAQKLQTFRQSVVSAAETLYEQNAITEDQWHAIAAANGFDKTESDVILQAAEFKRQAKAEAAVIGAIRSKYIGHHITKQEAGSALDKLGIVPNRRDYLLQLWEIETAANVRTLTPAQVVKAFNNQLIDVGDATDRLKFMGYNDVDAGLLLAGA